jgi:hypothetical protein
LKVSGSHGEIESPPQPHAARRRVDRRSQIGHAAVGGAPLAQTHAQGRDGQRRELPVRQLRVERNGCGNGRVYTITIRVQDLAGNRTTTSVKVLVPPNASSNTAIDDGPLFTVLSSCP